MAERGGEDDDDGRGPPASSSSSLEDSAAGYLSPVAMVTQIEPNQHTSAAAAWVHRPPARLAEVVGVRRRVPFQLMSDIHLELLKPNLRRFEHLIKRWRLPPQLALSAGGGPAPPLGETYLFLAGDIGWACWESYPSFLACTASRYRAVFVVAGNHEFYSPLPTTAYRTGFGGIETARRLPSAKRVRPVARCLEELRGVVAGVPSGNVFFLENDLIDMGAFAVAGCTLWTAVPAEHRAHISNLMNDYRAVFTKAGQLLDPEDVCAWNAASRAFLLRAVSHCAGVREGGKPLVVLTHHAPSHAMSDAKQGDPRVWAYGNSADSLSDVLRPPVQWWLSGHNHLTRLVEHRVDGGAGDIDGGGGGATVKLMSNAVGYPGEGNAGFRLETHWLDIG